MRWILATSSMISENLHHSRSNVESSFEKIKILSKELITFDDNKSYDVANILQLHQVAKLLFQQIF